MSLPIETLSFTVRVQRVVASRTSAVQVVRLHVGVVQVAKNAVQAVKNISFEVQI